MRELLEFCSIVALVSILACFIVLTILCPFWPVIAILGAIVGLVFVVFNFYWLIILCPMVLFVIFKITGQLK